MYDALLALAARWQRDAGVLRAYADERGAAITERHAAELRAVLATAEDETLTLTEAALESGYSTRRLRELIACGQIHNAGRKGVPRIRRADLPRKARPGGGGYDPRADAADILRRAS